MNVLDQLSRTIQLSSPIKRIISLVPSQTELLAHLHLDEEVIGITKFCTRPAHWWQTKTKIGGTKNLNLPLIRKLAPDLVIANKEENKK
ncbi:MAG: helical backbone metal receptor, partial [Chitinophagaceae bacterium]